MRVYLSKKYIDDLIDVLDELTPWGSYDTALNIINKRLQGNEHYWEQLSEKLRIQRDNMKNIRKIDRHEVVSAADIHNGKADAFIKTFIGKADKQKMWDNCIGLFNDDDELVSVCIITVTKRKPLSANLQLMHTFSKYRGKGYGKQLVDYAIEYAKLAGCEYFRVSAERTAVLFYAKCGIPFWGMQTSGTFLALFKLEGLRNEDDGYIRDKLLYKPGKLNLSRCDHPSKAEQEVIEKLGHRYLYNNL